MLSSTEPSVLSKAGMLAFASNYISRRKFCRLFHRMNTGLQLARNLRAYMRFMTLTSATTQKHKLMRSFEILKKRIHRATYQKDHFHGFKFNRYYCLKTLEGNGVLHVIFWGRFIPQRWLSKTWKQIHGAYRADIRACHTKNRNVKGLVGYLLTQYLSDQPIERMSYGWKWAWLGFCKSWKTVKEAYSVMRKSGSGIFAQKIVHSFKTGFSSHHVEAWLSTLWAPPSTSYQTRLSKFL